jgi:hypothetical protein
VVLSQKKFMERLGLVGEDFTGFVNTAATEVGHEHPEHIAEALIDMYKQAVQPPQFVNPEKEEEDAPEGEEADAKESSFEPHTSGAWTLVPLEVKTAGPMGVPMQYQQGESYPPEQEPWEQQNQQILQNPIYPQPGQQGPQMPAQPNGAPAMPAQQRAQQLIQQNQQPEQDPNAFPPMEPSADPAPVWHGAANNPADQPWDRTKEQGGEDSRVKCPECGGDGKTANNSTCEKCHGKGDVANFGGSVTDAVGDDMKSSSWTITTEKGNGDFGGPEPVINKDHKAPSPKDPDYGDTVHPTKHKDPIVPIVMKNRTESDLEEIGPSLKSESLPSAEGLDNSGFSTKTPGGKGPHTKTFNGDGQTTPVTHETM